MPQHIDAILGAAEARHLAVVRVNDNATRVTIRARPAWVVEVLVPDSVLEWFVSLKNEQSGEEVHSDWCDHYPTDSQSDAELQNEMRDSVLRFIDVVNQRELRVTQSKGIKLLGRSFFATHVLEALGSAGWQDVWTLVWPEVA